MRQQANKKWIFIEYTILFAILCLIVFYPFYHQGLSLIWGSNGKDGLSQHLNAVTYWGQYIRDFLNNLIHGQLKLPMWDNSIGYGSDILATLNYYAIGDPINLIYVFSNKYNAEYFYDFAMILRLYLAGGAFVCFGYYLKKDHIGTLFGSMAYVFSGYVMLGAVRHPFFINPMIYLPLLIMGVEKIYKKEKPYIFTIVVALAAMSNFYFFYMLTAVTVIYAFIRFPAYKEDGFFKTLARFAGWYMLGVGLSALVLIPVLIGFMGNARGASGVNYFMMWFYPKKYYKGLILQFIGYKNVARGTTLNYIALAYPAVIALFLKKQKDRLEYKVSVIVGGLCLLTPVCAYILHGLSYPVNRWIFAFSFLIGAVIMEVYPDLLSLTKIQKIGIFAGVIFYCGLVKWKAWHVKATKLAAVILIGTWIALILVNEIKFISESWMCHVLIGVAVAVSVTASAYAHFSPRMTSFTTEYLKSGQAYETLCGKEAKIVSSQKKEINDMYRTEAVNPSAKNWGIIDHIPTTTNYLSITDGNVSSTLKELGLTRYQYKFKFRRLDTREGLMDLFGIRYVTCQDFESVQLPDHYKLIKKQNGINLYENQNVFPFGYTYDSYLTKSQYEKLNASQKEEAMLHSAILEDDSVSRSELKKSGYESAITIKDIGTDYSVYKKKKGEQTLQIKIPKEYLTDNCYLYLQGVRCQMIGKQTEKHKIEEGFNSNGFHVNVHGHTTYMEITEKDSTYDIGDRDYLVKILNDKKGTGNTVTFTFRRKDIYSIKKLSIVQINKQKQDQAILERKNSEHLENISYDGSNHFSGEIKTSGSKMLCIPIPYSKGWKATDNGKSVNIEKVNGMFLGIHLDKGTHKIKLDYTTPGIKAGAVISVASVVILIVLWRRRKKQNY
jgi:uncharacterized membrane protein YfhO